MELTPPKGQLQTAPTDDRIPVRRVLTNTLVYILIPLGRETIERDASHAGPGTPDIFEAPFAPPVAADSIYLQLWGGGGLHLPFQSIGI